MEISIQIPPGKTVEEVALGATMKGYHITINQKGEIFAYCPASSSFFSENIVGGCLKTLLMSNGQVNSAKDCTGCLYDKKSPES